MIDITNTIDEVGLEIINICNGKCTDCLSTKIIIKEILQYDVNDIKKILPIKFLKNIKKISFTGFISEPTLNDHIKEMIKYIYSINIDIHIEIATNGCTHDSTWWEDLGSILKPFPHHVLFSIDGLKDTYSIYRKNLKYETALSNMKSFMRGGGYVIWQFIIFDHNKKDLKNAEMLSRELGCPEFSSELNYKEIIIDNQYAREFKLLRHCEQKWCELHYNSCGYKQYVIIDINGYVLPCDFINQDIVKLAPNIKNSTLLEILKSNVYYQYHKDLIYKYKICSNLCTIEYLKDNNLTLQDIL